MTERPVPAEPSKAAEWPERFRAEILEIELRRREADMAILRQAAALRFLARGGHRELGCALLGDLVDTVGIPARRGLELVDLGKAMAEHPDLEGRIRSAEIPIEGALVGARGIVGCCRDYDSWIADMSALPPDQLARKVDDWTRCRETPEGIRLESESLALSIETRAMIADAEIRVAQLDEVKREREALNTPLSRPESLARAMMPAEEFEVWRRDRVCHELRSRGRPVIRRHDALARAIGAGLEAIRRGVPVGARRYRVIEHTEESLSLVTGRVGSEILLLRVENPVGQLEQKPVPRETIDAVLARIRQDRGIETIDPIAIAGAVLDRGVAHLDRSDARALAQAVLEEIRSAVAMEGRAWYRISIGLACLEKLGFRGWKVLGEQVLRLAESTTSELRSCGRACRKFPELDRLAREGGVGWTKIRTLAPYLEKTNDISNFLALLSTCSVRELEIVRRALASKRTRSRPRRTPDRRMRIELAERAWDELEDLRVELHDRTGRIWSKAEALEEGLWHALVEWGAPAPLWRSYRILVHHDPRTDVHWMRGSGELFAISGEDAERIREAGTKTFNLGRALSEAERIESCRGRSIEVMPPAPDDLGERRLLPDMPVWEPPPPPAHLAIRRLVYLRDSGVCSVPGCRASRYLEVHHRKERSRGGGNAPSNLELDCTLCHTTTHSNYALVVPRSGPFGLHFAI